MHDYSTEIAKRESGRLYLLFDEIQEVREWEKAVNSFYSSGSIDCDIFVTGSNAYLLSSELATYLSGRFIEIPIFTLSFQEYMTFSLHFEKRELSVEKWFIEYLTLGGFPGIHRMSGDSELIRQYIQGIYATVLLKDVIQRNKIRDTELLERIAQFIFDTTGTIVSKKSIIDFLRSNGRTPGNETVYNDIAALSEARVIYKVPRYDIKGKKLLETMEKYYPADIGFRFALAGFSQKNIPGLLENVVFLELLRRGYLVTIGKIGSYEIDFVARKQDLIIYIQVCYQLSSEEVVERELRPLREINDNYPKYLLTLDEFPPENNSGIVRLNIREWLLGSDG